MAAAHPNSFKARKTLEGRQPELHLLEPEGGREGGRRPLAPALLAAHPAREPAAPRGRHDGQEGRHRRRRRLGEERRQVDQGDRLPPRPRADAGLHRRARRGRPRRDARRHGRRWAATREDQPAGAGRPGHRPLGAGRRVRHAARVRAQRRRSSSSATASATQFLRWGQKAFDNFRVVPPGTGICHQVNLEYLAQVVWTGKERQRDGRLSRHAGRHRLPHHHDQRPRRARLGRRRHRGRGGDARPADLDADPRGRRLQADRQAAARARPRPTWCSPSPRCCARRAWSASSSSSTAPGLERPAARRPRDHRQHGARVRRDLRLLPGRRRDARLPAGSPAARPSASRWSRPMPRSRACCAHDRRPSRCSPTRSSSTSATSSRRSPARSARRTACRSTPSRASRQFAADAGERVRPQGRRQARRRCEGAGLRPRPRRRRDRRHHQLHQHLEPLRDARRRPAREEGGRARA